MYDYLYLKNKNYPDDIALEYYGRKTSYQELLHEIDKCSRNLSALGIVKGDIVTVQAISLPQVIILIYALSRIGACGNMLYPDAKAEDVQSSMKKTNSHVLIVVDKILETYEQKLERTFNNVIILLNISDQMSLLPRLLVKRKAAYRPSNPNLNTITWKKFMSGTGKEYQDNHDGMLPAFMLRTGGTTGIPKEVVLDSNGFNSVAESVFYHGLSDVFRRGDKTILLLPPFIAFGIGTGVHNPLTYGARLIIALDISPSAIGKLVAKFKPKYLSAGVVQIEQLVNDLEKKQFNLNFLKLLWVGGEAVSHGFEEKLSCFLKSHGCSAIPLKGYGLTETTAGVTAEMVNARKEGSVGIPLAFCGMKIIDPETGRELSYNSKGEICLSGPGIMQGYYKDKQATDEVIEIMDGERWLHTGDIGYISEDGLLTITGRIKRIITCRDGAIYHKVFPLIIENQLSKLNGVQDIAIVGRLDETVGNVLVAYVIPTKREIFPETEKALRKYSESNLQIFERPVEYICLDAFPRTLIGKVDYRELEKHANDL